MLPHGNGEGPSASPSHVSYALQEGTERRGTKIQLIKGFQKGRGYVSVWCFVIKPDRLAAH